MAYKGNVLSINVSRDLPQGVQAVRSNGPSDLRFNPTAPPFVNSTGVEHGSAVSGVGNSTQPGQDLADYAPNAINHQHTMTTHEQKTADHGQERMRHLQSRHSISAATRFSPPSLGIHRALTPPRSRSNTIQYTPPHRPYHEPIAPSPIAESHQTGPQPSRSALLHERLDILQGLKKDNLVAFTQQSAAIDVIRSDLQHSWEHPKANERLPELYDREIQAQESEKLLSIYAKSFEMIIEEIEELWADIVVPDEARAEGEGAFLPVGGSNNFHGKGSYSQ